MRVLTKEKRSTLNNIYIQIRHVYIIIYMSVVAFAAMIPVRLVIDGKSGPVYNCLAGTGILLFVAEICLNFRKCLNWSGILRFLFMVACAISMIFNMKYGIVSNIKTLCWTGIQIFVLAGIDTDLSTEKILRHFRQFSEIFTLIWTFGVILSLRLFVLQYADSHWLMGAISATREGFVDGRLFGIFTDPNYASLCSCAVIFFAICNILPIKKRRKTLSIVYHAVVIFLQISYVILSGSRTAEVCVLGVSAGITLILVAKYCFSKKMNICLKVLLPLIFAVLAVVLCLLGWNLLKAGYSYVPGIYASFNENADKTNSKKEIVNFTRSDVANNDDISNLRFTIWKDYIEVFKTTPIVGTSPRNALQYIEEYFPDSFAAKRQFSVHNTYLALFVCTGILGGSIMMIWLLFIAIRVLKYLIRSSVNKPHYYVILMLSCIMMVDAMAAFPLMFMFFNNMIIDIVFWVTLGFLMALIRKSEEEIKQ